MKRTETVLPHRSFVVAEAMLDSGISGPAQIVRENGSIISAPELRREYLESKISYALLRVNRKLAGRGACGYSGSDTLLWADADYCGAFLVCEKPDEEKGIYPFGALGIVFPWAAPEAAFDDAIEFALAVFS